MNAIVKLLILLTGCFCLYLLIAVFKVLYKYWWMPLHVQHILRSQGIKGPSYKFIHGSNKEATKLRNEELSKPMALTHDIFPRAMPHVSSWINRYGKNYLSWDGIRAQPVITEPELVKEVLKNSEKAFPKRNPPIHTRRLLGDGLVTTEGEKWVKHRKLANYAFHGESLKKMIPTIIASVEMMLDKWNGQEGKEIDVFQEFRLLTSEVISRTAFGSSYLEGEKIFDLLKKLSISLIRNQFKARVPVINKFWKTADDIEADKLVKEIQESVMEIVKKREDKVGSGEDQDFGSDFLGLLVNAYHHLDEKNRFSLDDLVDNCKTFNFAGQETTNSLLAWTVLVLAIHTDWQEKARSEVIEIFGNQIPHSEGIAKLKTITMVINETLRLYGPANGVIRKDGRKVQLGKLVLPANIELVIPNMALHHDPQSWGDDVHLFKPERFEEGIATATFVYSFRIGTSILCWHELRNHRNKDCYLNDSTTIHHYPLPCLCPLTIKFSHTSATTWNSSNNPLTA
ncbi:hypothetical protein PTKIN_Ptkin09bG0225900 [Pterospermum kingtungense]